MYGLAHHLVHCFSLSCSMMDRWIESSSVRLIPSTEAKKPTELAYFIKILCNVHYSALLRNSTDYSCVQCDN